MKNYIDAKSVRWSLGNLKVNLQRKRRSYPQWSKGSRKSDVGRRAARNVHTTLRVRLLERNGKTKL